MKLYNLKKPEQTVSFQEAVKIGLGDNRGLFFPESIQPMDNIDELLNLGFVERSTKILSHLIGDELPASTVAEMVSAAFNFDAPPLATVSDNARCLELFHGPTLAFKDFGARFMAQCLAQFGGDDKLTIVTATSGDTGAAVAHAFHGLDKIDVVILYPDGGISDLQEKLFCTLGGNIHTLAVKGTFDNCQALVKTVFEDAPLKEQVNLNSANSINISRLLAQTCYYFEAISQLTPEQREQAVISVPSGNFGNLTAGIIAMKLGMPVKRFIAATNVNDTVPRYWNGGCDKWEPKATIPTKSNAMDVSEPNNWPRIEEIKNQYGLSNEQLVALSVDEATTADAVKALNEIGYVSEPHAGVAYQAIRENLQDGEIGIFLGTAHPAKFKADVEAILQKEIDLPTELAEASVKPLLSDYIANNYEELKAKILSVG